MIRKLEQGEIDGRTRAQKWDIDRRKEFVTLNTPTKQAIIDILANAEVILHEDGGKEVRAQQYILQTIWNQQVGCDDDSVNWGSVDFHIKEGCFSDHDMEGLLLAPRRVWAELTIFRSLMELNPNNDEYDRYENMF